MPIPYVAPDFIEGEIFTEPQAQGMADAIAAVPVTGRPSRRVTGSTTLVLNDAGGVIEVDSASAATVTIPATSSVALPGDAEVEIIQTNTGVVTAQAAAGVTVVGRPGLSPMTPQQWGSLRLRKRVATPTTAPTGSLIGRWRGSDLGSAGSAISTWTESSGQSLPDAVQATSGNRPVVTTAFFGGAKAALFDGVNDFLSLSGTALNLARNKGAITIFAIVETPGSVANTTQTMFALSRNSDATHRAALGWTTGASGPFYSAGGRRLDADAVASVVSTVVPAISSRSVLAARYDWTNSDLYLSRNGTQVAASTSFQTSGSTSDTASASGAIGARADGTTEFFSGAVAEILVYSGNDSSGAIRAQVEAYAQDTYGVVVTGYSGSVNQWIALSGSQTDAAPWRTYTGSAWPSLSIPSNYIGPVVWNSQGHPAAPEPPEARLNDWWARDVEASPL